MRRHGKNREAQRKLGEVVLDACAKGKTPFRIMVAKIDGPYMVTIRKLRPIVCGPKTCGRKGPHPRAPKLTFWDTGEMS